jgi:hypothetical protein
VIPIRTIPTPEVTYQHHQRHPDCGQAGSELAVDDVVTVDRLRYQPRQGAVRTLLVER